MSRPPALVFALLLSTACVAKPEAARSGGTPCTADRDCNEGPLCGEVSLCVQGFCAVDTVFRACADGGYPDAGRTTECITWVSCNTATCGSLVACANGVCDPSAPRINVPCDAGRD